MTAGGGGALAAWFDEVYRQSGRRPAAIPWARLEPEPLFARWLEDTGPPPGRAAVVGCGLGDDAEALAARGHDVVAFDASPEAIAWCGERFPSSRVDYRVADLLALPPGWRSAFDLVVEVFTVQSLALRDRDAAIDAVASLVAPGGRAFVVALGRPDEQYPSGPPFPVSRREMDRFTACGLVEHRFEQVGLRFLGIYRRPAR